MQETAKLMEIFEVGDTDGSGTIDWQEFQEMLASPKVVDANFVRGVRSRRADVIGARGEECRAVIGP